MTTLIVPVLMVGGSGTRLWPVSRRAKPKQFQSLISDKSLFQETASRVTGHHGDVEFTAPLLIGAETYERQIRDQLAEIDLEPLGIILEPSAQNTAAVAAIAARYVADHKPRGLVLLLPSDAYIKDQNRFRDAIADAAPVAADGWITTLGITPERAETGFGYIQQGAPLLRGCFRVEAFKEKPDLETAQTYLKSSVYSWNAGIFLFRPETMIAEMQKYAADVLASAISAYEEGNVSGNVLGLNTEVFATVRKVSIDYAVMEKTDRAAVYGGLDCGWSDVGGWSALADMKLQNNDQKLILADSETSYFRNDGSVLVAAIGLEDMVVIVHEGAVLVLPTNRSQDVKAIIGQLEDRKLTEYL